MNLEETQFDYDKDNDTLFIFKKEAVKGSVDIGNYIVDFTHEGSVAGLEIMNVSEVLKNLGVESPSDFLESVKHVSFKSVQKRDSVSVYAQKTFSFLACQKASLFVHFVISSKTEVSSSIAIPVCIK